MNATKAHMLSYIRLRNQEKSNEFGNLQQLCSVWPSMGWKNLKITRYMHSS